MKEKAGTIWVEKGLGHGKKRQAKRKTRHGVSELACLRSMSICVMQPTDCLHSLKRTRQGFFYRSNSISTLAKYGCTEQSITPLRQDEKTVLFSIHASAVKTLYRVPFLENESILMLQQHIYKRIITM